MPMCACGTPIFFAGTPAGRSMPVEAGTLDQDSGDLAVWRDGGDGSGGPLFCRVLRKDESPGPGEHRGFSHWARCPHRDQHRKPR